jgi:hypothetical protein
MAKTNKPVTHTVYLCRKIGNEFEWLEGGNGYCDANGNTRALIDRLPLGDEMTGDGWTGHMQLVPLGAQPKQGDPDRL